MKRKGEAGAGGPRLLRVGGEPILRGGGNKGLVSLISVLGSLGRRIYRLGVRKGAGSEGEKKKKGCGEPSYSSYTGQRENSTIEGSENPQQPNGSAREIKKEGNVNLGQRTLRTGPPGGRQGEEKKSNYQKGSNSTKGKIVVMIEQMKNNQLPDLAQYCCQEGESL